MRATYTVNRESKDLYGNVIASSTLADYTRKADAERMVSRMARAWKKKGDTVLRHNIGYITVCHTETATTSEYYITRN